MLLDKQYAWQAPNLTHTRKINKDEVERRERGTKQNTTKTKKK
jgi:hypothetical protein